MSARAMNFGYTPRPAGRPDYAQSHWPYTMRRKNGCPSTCSVLSTTAPTVQSGNASVVNVPIASATARPDVRARADVRSQIA